MSRHFSQSPNLLFTIGRATCRSSSIVASNQTLILTSYSGIKKLESRLQLSASGALVGLMVGMVTLDFGGIYHDGNGTVHLKKSPVFRSPLPSASGARRRNRMKCTSLSSTGFTISFSTSRSLGRVGPKRRVKETFKRLIL